MISVQLVVPIGREEVVTDGDGEQLVADVEVRTKGALHRSLATSNWKAQGNRDVVNDVLERMPVLDGGEEGWTVT